MKQVPLSEVAEFINGRAFKPEDWQSEGLPIIRIQNLTGSTNTVNYYSGKVEPRYLVKNDDILISWSASLGVYKWQGGDAILNQHIFKVELKEKLIDKEYFYYAAQNALVEMESHVHGATMQHITRDPFLAIEIPLPPLPEQKRIASLLARADRLRQLRRTARDLGDELLQSVFLEMFGDALAGKNPKIPLVPLETLCTKITDGTHVTPTYLNDGVPFLSVKNITKFRGQLDFSDIKYISPEEHKKISKLSNVERDDILYTKVGATYGYAQIVDTDREFSIFVSVALLKPNKSKILPKFFEVVMNSVFVKEQADRLVSGIGVPDLHLREIKTFQIPLPPLSKQEEFAGVVARVESLRGRMGEAGRQVNGLFESLLAEAFS